MHIVQKISLAYDQEQDRIAVTADTLDGQPLALWLTQRLALRLCTALGNWLDEDVHQRAATLDAPSVHAWEQSSASEQLRPGAAVDPGAAPLVALINAADIGRAGGDCLLALKWAPELGAQVAMNPIELRQWLGILYRLFRSAEWPTQGLPAWLGTSAEVGPGSSRALH